MMNLGLNPKYQLVTSLPYHCVPACLEMILKRNGITDFSQETIGQELSVIIPEFHTLENENYGVVFNDNEVINAFFKRHQLPFKETYTPYNHIPNDMLFEFIEEEISKNHDIMVGFYFSTLYTGKGKRAGHVALIESLLDPNLVLVDPGSHPNFPAERKEINLYNLVQAITERKNGYSIISKIN